MPDLPAKWLTPLVFRNGRSLPNRIIPGPMDGVSEGSFITVMSEANLVSSWFTPFIRISTGVPRLARLREKITPYLATGLPVIVQIMGTRHELLAETAARLHREGATCVDLNCACPSHTVLGSRSGGFLLRDPEGIRDAITAMKKACGDAPISVKIRCGYESPDEIPDIAAALREAAPDMVTCHFRTVLESYREAPDGLERLARMRELLPGIPLIGSGDLYSVEDALRMYRQCGVDGVAPARGLLKNPALLRQIEAACAGEPFDGKMQMSEEEFLRALGSRSNRKRRIFVLKVAKVMYGEDSDAFRKLLEAHAAQE